MISQLQTSDPQGIVYPDSGVSFTTLEQERQRAELAEQRAARLAEQLRAMGVDPD